jgi:hypothetical protein
MFIASAVVAAALLLHLKRFRLKIPRLKIPRLYRRMPRGGRAGNAVPVAGIVEHESLWRGDAV